MLRAARNGDAAARSVFAEAYSAPVRAYLRRRWAGGRLIAEVDDALQDVFVECIKPDGVLQRADPAQGGFRDLLYGVVRNVARRYEERAVARASRRAGESVYLDELPAQQEALSRLFDREWSGSLLREALLRYASAARQGDDGARRRLRILSLRHQRGLPVREIAAAFGEPEVERVHNDYRRARREFGAVLREVVAARTGAQGAAVDAECRQLIELLHS